MSGTTQSVADTTALSGTIAQRNQARPKGRPREWGMFFTAIEYPNAGEAVTFYLRYNEASTNIFDNNNWVEYIS